MTFQSTSTGLDHTLVVCEWRFSPLLRALITHWLSVNDVTVHFYGPWSHIGCLWMTFQSTSMGLDHTLVVCEWRFSPLLRALITHWLSVNDVSVLFYGPWSHIGCLWMTFQSTSTGLDHTLVVCEWRFSPLLWALITHWLSVNDVSVHFYGPWSHIGCLWMTFQSTSTGLDHTLVVCEWRFSALLWALITHWLSMNDVSVHFYRPWSHIGCLWMTFQSTSTGLDHTLVVCEWRFSPLLWALITHWLSVNDVSVHFYGPWSHIGCLWMTFQSTSTGLDHTLVVYEWRFSPLLRALITHWLSVKDVSVHFYGPWSHIGCLWMTVQSTSTGLDHTLVVCEWRFSPLLRALITHWLSVNDVSVLSYGPWSHIGCLWMTFQSTSTGLDHTLVVCEWRFSPLLQALITHWLSVNDVSVHFYGPWSHIGCLWMTFQSTSTGLDHTLVVCEWRFSPLLQALITHWLSVNDVSVHFYGPWSHIGCLWMTFQSTSMGLDHTLVVCEWRFSPLLRALITHWLSVNDVSVHFYGPWSHIGCLWMTFQSTSTGLDHTLVVCEWRYSPLLRALITHWLSVNDVSVHFYGPWSHIGCLWMTFQSTSTGLDHTLVVCEWRFSPLLRALITHWLSVNDVSVHFYGPWSHIGCLWMTLQSTSTGLDHTLVVCEWRFSPLLRALITHWLSVNDVTVHFYGPWSHIGCLWMTFQSTSTGLDHTLVVCEWRFSPLLRALITHWLSVNDVSVHFYGPWSHFGCLWMTLQSTSMGLDHTLVVCEWRFSPLLWALITHWLSVNDVSVHFYGPWSHIGCLWMTFQSSSMGPDHTLVVCEWRFSPLLWALITHWLSVNDVSVLRALITHWLSVNDVSVHFYGPWSHIGCLWMTFQYTSMGLDHTLVVCEWRFSPTGLDHTLVVCEWRFSPLLRALITHWLSVNDVTVHFYGPWSHIGCLWMTFQSYGP